MNKRNEMPKSTKGKKEYQKPQLKRFKGLRKIVAT